MRASRVVPHYRGDNKVILGIVLAVITFWLFAQTTLNVAPAMRNDLGITESMSNIAVSITALFSGIFIVVAGGLADHFGRMRFTFIGLLLSSVGSLLIALSPTGTATFLMIGRVVKGVSAACMMPATLALMKAYFDGKDRQRALSSWSIGSLGGSGLSALFGGFVASTLGWRWIFWMSIAVAAVSWLLLRGTPENKAESTERRAFDSAGLMAFIVMMVALNIVIGQGASVGWMSGTVVTLTIVFLGSTAARVRACV
jgi:MFS transporter, DHA2 family, multidrug resistance protein